MLLMDWILNDLHDEDIQTNVQTIDEKSFKYRTSIESKSKWLHKIIIWLYRRKEKKKKKWKVMNNKNLI